jgi:hypothetical protein
MIFAFSNYYPDGGFDDFKGVIPKSANLDEIKNFIKEEKIAENQNIQIIDLTTLKKIDEYINICTGEDYIDDIAEFIKKTIDK